MRRNRHIGVLFALIFAASAGLVTAQPNEPPQEEALPPTEEAPPTEVIAQPPVTTPPVKPSEVTVAAPPKEQVAPKPAESVKKRTRNDVAILQALDKVTAETVRFEARVGQPVRYKTLVITVKACEQTADDEPQDDSMAYLTVESQPRAAPGKPTPAPRQVFRGWMFASSPSLSPLEHSVYDTWLITCKATVPAIAALR